MSNTDKFQAMAVEMKELREMIQSLVKPQTTPQGTTQGDAYDPRVTLTGKPGAKATHITQFLSEKTKARRRNKNRDLILTTQEVDQVPIVIRPEETHPYSGITLDEWSGANFRLLNHLLSTGLLPRSDIEFYLAYSATICDFYQKYEWHSILEFDYQYREHQAAFGFTWGYINPTLELQILVPRQTIYRNQISTQQERGDKTSRNPRPFRDDVDCRQWKANGYCGYGDECRFHHVSLDRSHNTPEQGSKNEEQHRRQ